MLPFMYLAPKMHRVMPDVAVSLFSVNWAIWFTFGMISPKRITNVDHRHRRDIVHGRIYRSLNARERDLSASGTRLGASLLCGRFLTEVCLNGLALVAEMTPQHVRKGLAIAGRECGKHFLVLFDCLRPTVFGHIRDIPRAPDATG